MIWKIWKKSKLNSEMIWNADVVWDTKTQILINKQENVQVEAARIVTGGTRFVSLSNLYTNACRSHTNIEQNDDFQIHK